ncbi:MAG: hypothetical protein QG657_4613 [Acidobacteriota bacterium]|nr:hypothetical protein [Acidobacteriota bacterium]
MECFSKKGSGGCAAWNSRFGIRIDRVGQEETNDKN